MTIIWAFGAADVLMVAAFPDIQPSYSEGMATQEPPVVPGSLPLLLTSGRQVRSWRLAAGVSVGQVAWYTNISRRTLQNWEAERRPIPKAANMALSRPSLWRDLPAMNGVRPPTWKPSMFEKRRRWLEREGVPRGLLRPVRDA